MNKSERRRRTQKVVAKRVKVLKNIGAELSKKNIGRCKDTHPMDCGRPQCNVCGRKRRLLGKTGHELKNEKKFKEGLDEIG